MERNFKITLVTIFFSFFLMFSCLSFLSANAKAYEETGIEIEIDYGDYDEYDLPVGVKGKTYPVFGCKTIDNAGNSVGNLNVLVLDPDGNAVAVISDRFKTDKVGEYKIIYTVSVKSVYETEEVTVKVVEACEDINYVIDSSIPDAVATGDRIFLLQGKANGGVGIINVSSRITYAGEYDCSEIITSVIGDKESFVPIVSGKYTITFTAIDFVGNTIEKSKDIVVTDSKYPILHEPTVVRVTEALTPTAVPFAEAMIYRNGEIIYLPVKVFFDGKDITNTLSFTAESAGKHVIKYECVNVFDNEYKTDYSYEINVIEKNAGVLFFDKYFYFENFVSSFPEDSDAYLVTTDESGDAFLQFKSKIATEYLKMDLGLKSDISSFGAMTLRLSDSEKADDFAEIKLSDYNLSDGISVSFDKKSNAATIEETVTDKNGKKITQSNVIVFESYADGRAFKGFRSGKAIISITIEELNKKSVLAIYSIAGNLLPNVSSDKGSPMFLTNEEFSGFDYVDKGETVYVKPLEAFDLLDENVKVNVTVSFSDGKQIYNGELSRDYSFTAESYGSYTIKYIATDSSGNRTTKTAMVYVVDRIPPEIQVENIKQVVKVGDTLKLPEATITDNYSEKFTSYIYVKKGNFNKELVKNNEYTFKEVGSYTIRYVAYDDSSNYSVVEFTIECR